jgi:hypothetical protein
MESNYIAYSFALSQFYFWSYLGLTLFWGCKIKRVNKKTLIETSTILTVACLNMVLLLQAIYISLKYFGSVNDSKGKEDYMLIDKFSEVCSSFIVYHFILELRPVLIMLNTDLTMQE